MPSQGGVQAGNLTTEKVGWHTTEGMNASDAVPGLNVKLMEIPVAHASTDVGVGSAQARRAGAA